MTGHRDLINVKSRGAQGDATASRACDVCRYGVGCGFGVPIDLDPTILSTGLAGLTRFETSPTCAPRCCWLRLNSTSTTPSGSRALAQTSPGGILNIGGTGRLITTRRVQTATHGGDVLADIYTFKAIHRGNQVHANAILAMHPDVIDAFYRFVASGSTSEPQIFWQARNGPLLGKQVLEWSTMPQASRPRVSD
jgi:hypothetical protein